MTGVLMIKAFAIVLALSVIGDAAAVRLGIPIPGAAIGMTMLAALFIIRGGPDKGFAGLFDAAAPHFPLFFVPAAVGVIASADLLASAWVHIAIAIALSTAATIAITGITTSWLMQTFEKARHA